MQWNTILRKFTLKSRDKQNHLRSNQSQFMSQIKDFFPSISVAVIREKIHLFSFMSIAVCSYINNWPFGYFSVDAPHFLPTPLSWTGLEQDKKRFGARNTEHCVCMLRTNWATRIVTIFHVGHVWPTRGEVLYTIGLSNWKCYALRWEGWKGWTLI